MGWSFKNVAGFGLAGGGARRARALLLSCAVRSAAPGGPARSPPVRPRSLVLPPPPPPPLHGRARPAPPCRPPARVPGESWSGVGPVCLPPAPSPESQSLGERKGEGAGGEGGEDRSGRAAEASGDRHPAGRLGGGAGAHAAGPAGPGPLLGREPVESDERPLPSPPHPRGISVNWRERGLAVKEEGNSWWRPIGSPSPPPAPLALPSALAAQWLLRVGVSGGD
nr:translation initiation factor IF-2 [Oryctolagus cuniculus]